jgi:hypothetical protein
MSRCQSVQHKTTCEKSLFIRDGRANMQAHDRVFNQNCKESVVELWRYFILIGASRGALFLVSHFASP